MTVVLVHEVRWRVRFRVQGLKYDNRRAEWLRSRIVAVPGVVGASASALTGSLIVTHDGETATREQIAAALEGCGHSIVPGAQGAASVIHLSAGRAEAHPLLRVLAEVLVERLLHTALAAVV